MRFSPSSREGVRRIRVPARLMAGRGDLSRRLAARNLALCVADSDKMSTPVRVTADYAYFRLRDEGYTPDDIRRWGDASRAKRDPAATCSSISSTRRR